MCSSQSTSRTSRFNVDVAIEAAGQTDRVHVVHVLRDLSPGEPGVTWGDINNENRKRHVEEKLLARFSDAKYAGIKAHVEMGDAGFRIADCAQKLGADLIVMPSHGRTGVKRLLIGSVAERVLRLAHCPVLVMRD